MANPYQFPQSNFTWKGFDTRPGQPNVIDLPAYRDKDEGFTVSCWKLTWRERLSVLLTGRTWLWVWGTHPPVAIDGTSPFGKGKK